LYTEKQGIALKCSENGNNGGRIMNASYNESLTNGLREIICDISEYLLREGVGIVVLDDFQWFIETITLMAKQVNLCDGCIALLENGMEQEAYILARSQFNNLLWIRYLLSDTDGSHLK
jgi:hypothetical protein